MLMSAERKCTGRLSPVSSLGKTLVLMLCKILWCISVSVSGPIPLLLCSVL